jgi:hypothetical protein
MRNNSDPIVRPPKILPYILAFAAAFVVIGIVFPEKEVWGAVLASAASILVWLLTYVNSEQQERAKTESFKIVVWTELMGLSRVLYSEAKAWDEAQGNRPTGDETEFNQSAKRLTAVFQLAAITANLNRVSDLGPRTAEGIIITLAGLKVLPQAIGEVYSLEDRLLQKLQDTEAELDRALSERKIDTNFKHKTLKTDYLVANEIQYANRIKIIKLLVHTSEQAYLTAVNLDKDGAFSAFQKSTQTETRRAEYQAETESMRLMHAQYRNLGEWTKETLAADSNGKPVAE